MNRFFGEPWDAPFIDVAQRVPTPAGQACLTCQEPVVEGEQGVITPYVYVAEDGAPAQRDVAQHRECFLLGVCGHLAAQCPCFPDKGTPRERGLATLAWVRANRH